MTIKIVCIVAKGVVRRLAKGIVEGLCFVRVGLGERARQGG